METTQYSIPTTQYSLPQIASQVRRDILRMVHGCQSGHPGGSLGCADLLVALYFQQMKINNRKGKGGYLSFNLDGKGEKTTG